MATGSEILSYKGDAALAIGSDAEATAAFGFDRASVQGINETLGKVMQHQLVWNTMLYGQAIKDRDDTYKLFSEQDIGFPVLDEDRPELQKRVDKIKDMMIETPNIKANREKYIQLQGEINSLKALKSSAKTRYASAIDQRQKAALELNPDKKAKMEESLNAQIKKGVDRLIDPYSEFIDYDEKDLLAPPSITTFKSLGDIGGIPHRTKMTMPDPQAYTTEVDFGGLTTGDSMSKAYKVKKFYEQQSQNPELMNKANLDKANATIASFNAANGYKEGDRFFAKPLGSVDSETGVASPGGSAIDFWKSYKVASTWKVSTAQEVDEDALKGRETAMKISTGYQDSKSRRITAGAAATNAAVNAKKADAEIEKLRADAKKARAEGDSEVFELKSIQAAGLQTANDVLQTYSSIARDDKGYASPTNLINKVFPARSPELKITMESLGIDDTWKMKDLGRGTENMRKMLSKSEDQYYGGNAELGTPDSKVTKVSRRPDRFMSLKSPDGDPNKIRLIGFDAKGNVINVMDANEAGINMLHEAANFADDINFEKKAGALRLGFEKFGGDVPGFDVDAAMNWKVETLTDGTQLIRVGDEYRDPKTNDVVARKINGVWVNQ